MTFDELPNWLVVCEGIRLKPYLDTEKKWTIGIGRNISDRLFTHAEAFYLVCRDPNQKRANNLNQKWYYNLHSTLDYLKERSISVEEAHHFLNNDIEDVLKELKAFDWYSIQPESIQCALANMCFNLGLPRLLKFTKMIGYLSEKNYTKAAIEALNSKWARQVKTRAKDIALIFTSKK